MEKSIVGFPELKIMVFRKCMFVFIVVVVITM